MFELLMHVSNGGRERHDLRLEQKVHVSIPIRSHPTCVPPVVTRGPGQGAFEGTVEVQERPHWHQDSAEVRVDQDDHGRYPNP